MTVVVDASVVAAWLLPDEHSDEASRVQELLSEDLAIAPTGWPNEVANAFLSAERQRRITPADTAYALGMLRDAGVRVVPDTGDPFTTELLELARQYGLTVYDAAYLALAIRERAGLATLDGDLRRAAQSAGVNLVGGS